MISFPVHGGIRQSLYISGRVTAHLFHGYFFPFKSSQGPGMRHNLAESFGQRHLPFLFPCQEICCLREYPWISISTPCDHDAVAAGFLQHTKTIFRSKNITVAENRDLYSLFYPSDHAPIRLSHIKLLPGTTMHSKGRHTGLFRDPGNFRGIAMSGIPAGAKFHCNRNADRTNHGRQNLACQFRRFH